MTIYWLGHVASASNFEGPELDFNAFSGLFEHHHVNLIPEKTSVYSSYWENKRLQSNHSTKPGTIHEENTSRDHEDQHAGDSSYESIGSKGSDDTQSVGSVDGMLEKSDIYQFGGSMSSLNKTHKVYSGNVENDMYQSASNIYQGKLHLHVFCFIKVSNQVVSLVVEICLNLYLVVSDWPRTLVFKHFVAGTSLFKGLLHGTLYK